MGKGKGGGGGAGAGAGQEVSFITQTWINLHSL